MSGLEKEIAEQEKKIFNSSFYLNLKTLEKLLLK